MGKGASFDVAHAVGGGEGAGLIGRNRAINTAFTDQVQFVAHEQHFGIRVTVLLYLLKPILSLVEGAAIGEVEDQEHPGRLLVVVTDDRAVLFIAGWGQHCPLTQYKKLTYLYPKAPPSPEFRWVSRRTCRRTRRKWSGGRFRKVIC